MNTFLSIAATTHVSLTKRGSLLRSSRLCGLMLTVCGLVAAATSGLAVPYGKNLLTNGDAESGSASSTGAAVQIPGWSVIGPVSVVPYGAGNGFPTENQGPQSGGAPTGGFRFFAGGDCTSSGGQFGTQPCGLQNTTSIRQSIDVSANAGDIDEGNVLCDISGWLGGFANQDDNATFTVTFAAADGTQLASATIGPVSASDRGNVTGLRERTSISNFVPAGTRTLVAQLVMQMATANYNDGYADNLSVVLRGPVVVTNTSDSGAGSLRDAINSGTVITFDPAVFGAAKGPQTITISGSLPPWNNGRSLTGPGAKLLTIKQQNTTVGDRLLKIHTAGSSQYTDVSGVTIADTPFGAMSLSGGGNLLVHDCAFVHNGMLNDSSFSNQRAGVLENINSHATFFRCLMTENKGGGPGVVTNFLGTTSLRNCTIDNNITLSDGTLPKGVIRNSAATGTINIESCTIVDNTAGVSPNGGSGLIKLSNTILALNGTNFTGSPSEISSRGFNLSDLDDSQVLNEKGDLNKIDPNLGPLQDNGGDTMTRALLPGSPAIDAGNSSEEDDQRGFSRFFDDPTAPNGTGNLSDIGAFEIAPAELLNLSTRKQVGTGDDVLIGGFIITGFDSTKVMLRGLGRSLPVSGALDDPTLELHNATGTIEFNDNWQDSDAAEIAATGIPPTSDAESAIVRTLEAKPAANGGAAYTAVLSGKNAGTGIGLLEVFKLDKSPFAKLANISTRGFVGNGDDLLIGGFIPGPFGRIPLKVLIRALGPSLAAQGVAGALQDPVLELHDANGTLILNDNWKDGGNAAEIQATLPPSDDHESAIITTLPPSSSGFTAVVRGANGSTGVALVEVYGLN